jgi:hypothetical protein
MRAAVPGRLFVPTDLNDDPRWVRLHNGRWRCSICGMWHSGLFDLACDHPESWPGGDKVPNEEMTWDLTSLCEDFCIVNGEHFFIRCVLDFPIVGAPGERFGFGVWSAVREVDFVAYSKIFDDDEPGPAGPWLGRVANTLKGYPETFNLKCKLYPQQNRRRPLGVIDRVRHPIRVEQRDGITFDRILELYDLNGHGIDLTPSHES